MKAGKMYHSDLYFPLPL